MCPETVQKELWERERGGKYILVERFRTACLKVGGNCHKSIWRPLVWFTDEKNTEVGQQEI